MAGEPLLRRNLLGVVIANETDCDNVTSGCAEFAFSFIERLSKAADLPLLKLTGSEFQNVAGDDVISACVAKLQRRVLLIGGGLLEGAVTQIALSALVDGFDVFIGADLVWTAEPGREPLFFDRITHCCGHVLTRRQILLELLAQEKDEGRRERLKGLLGGAAG